MRDVFDTRRFAGNSMTNTFSQSFYVKRETQIVLVSARYNFWVISLSEFDYWLSLPIKVFIFVG